MTPLVLDPPWLAAARKYKGVRETPGAKSTPLILSWAKSLRGWWKTFFNDDAIPWCAVLANESLVEAGVDGTGTARALDFATWGDPLLSPSLGAILVFKRPAGAHVGFYLGEAVIGKTPCYRVFGGNQSDAVSETWIAKDRCVAIRWPAQSIAPKSGPISLAPDGATLSTDEA